MRQHFTQLLSKREKEKGRKEGGGSFGKDTEKVKLLCTAGGKCKMVYGLYRKQYGTSSKNQSYYTQSSASPHLDADPRELKAGTQNTCTAIFTVLFPTAKRWTQAKCSTGPVKWITKYAIHTRKLSFSL